MLKHTTSIYLLAVYSESSYLDSIIESNMPHISKNHLGLSEMLFVR